MNGNRYVSPVDARTELAKMIYGMTDAQQRQFRQRYPAGFSDDDVPAATDYATRITL